MSLSEAASSLLGSKDDIKYVNLTDMAAGAARTELNPTEGPSTSAATIDDVKKARARNIKVTMYYTFLNTLVFSVIQWNIFDAYLAVLSRSLGMKYVNSSVGVAESIAGVTSLLLSFPVGYLVDSHDRIKLLKVAAMLGCTATLISSYAFAYDNVVVLYSNLFLWGMFSQVSESASGAIFTDSIATGNRSALFSKRCMVERLGLSFGPAIMALLFLKIGENWTLGELHIPLLLGCCLAPVPCLCLCFYVDPHADFHVPYSHKLSPIPTHRQLTCDSPKLCFTPPHRIDDTPETFSKQHTVDSNALYDALPTKEKAIPYIVALSDFIRSVGAGMTVKFFPLFFIKDFSFRPLDISLLFTVYPFVMSLATIVLQKLSLRIGRAQAAMIFQMAGIVFLLGMCYLQNVWLMVAFFILRGSFQNAGYPIDRSIIMDYVPSKRRGMWNAIESFTSMTWSGSAIVGGMMSDVHDYRYSFFFTACIYVFAMLVYIPLIWMVPKVENDVAMARKATIQHDKISRHTSFDTIQQDDDFEFGLSVLSGETTRIPTNTEATRSEGPFLFESDESDTPFVLLEG